MLLNSVATTRPGTGLVLAGAVDFDGANDYLSRASDLTGNADGKTFTFSAWVWPHDPASGGRIYEVSDGVSTYYFQAIISGTTSALLQARNSAGTVIFQATVTGTFMVDTVTHLLVSVDLANTANRSAYVNDVAASVTWTTYTNDSIDFTRTTHRVGGSGIGGAKLFGRLSNVFLDYTYRNLSVEANRRLFITSDRKPVNKSILTALNPILYLPMDDPSTAHVNAGTGGNFTLNGTIARSGRGANQFNVPYSTLNGTTQYLNRSTAITGIADSKVFTFACSFNADSLGSTGCIFSIGNGLSNRLTVTINNSNLAVYGIDATTTYCLQADMASITYVAGRNYHFVFSCDLANSANRHAYLNGVAATVTWSTYLNAAVDFSTVTPNTSVGLYAGGTNYYTGKLGNVFFHTSYIDLSNAANLAKFVTGTGIDAKPVDMGANGELPLGVQPLIYLPMYGNNAGKNYGSGGDFTVNSGPYPGARGPNEFWGNKADFDGSTGYLARTSALTGVSDGKTFSCSFSVNIDVNAIRYIFLIANGASDRLRISWSSAAPTFDIAGTTSGGSSTLYATCGTTLSTGTQYFVQICIDLTNTSNRKIYINGVLDSTTWTTYSNNDIQLSAANQRIGINAGTTSKLDGKLSEFYFTTDYIDFSQESNRLKFRDAFGNPVDLTPQIQAGTLPNPAIYMRFDPADQGKNSGTGGNFTKTGTIADGGQL